jgi:hypothetical protein
MTRPRINVKDIPPNHVNWGKLVKTWSTGMNYVRHKITDAAPFPTTLDVPPEFPRPTTFAEFVGQCQLAGVELFFDDGVQDLDVTGTENDMSFKLVEVPSNTAVVRVPPSDKIKESETRLLAGGYKLPNFYQRIHETDVKPTQVDTPSKRAVLHAERIGEYTINTCM